MSARRAVACVPAALVLMVWLAPLAARPAPPQDPPTFRSGASAVAVDVSVRDARRRPMTGLAASDFQVFDNGVLQQVEDVSYGKLPIDVTVALDVSYSVTGAVLDRLRSAVVQLMHDLTPQDRLKLILFNMRVNRTIDYTVDVKMVERAIRAATAGGSTSLFDAVSVALVSGSTPDRRQLLVFFTDGSDSSSITTPDMLAQVAQRTRGTLAFVMPIGAPGSASGRGRSLTSMPRAPGYATIFSRLTAETGGTVLPVGPSSDLSAAFRTVLSEFRSAYVLYYNARDVPREGYHAIRVTVNRDGAQVQARRGYFGS